MLHALVGPRGPLIASCQAGPRSPNARSPKVKLQALQAARQGHMKHAPKLKDCKLPDMKTLCHYASFWVKSCAKLKDNKMPGKVTLSKLWLKWYPKVKDCKPPGKAALFKLWLKNCPKVKDCKTLGNSTSSRRCSQSSKEEKACVACTAITLRRWPSSASSLYEI